jgi:polyisoprenoid-binding protein YceI
MLLRPTVKISVIIAALSVVLAGCGSAAATPTPMAAPATSAPIAANPPTVAPTAPAAPKPTSAPTAAPTANAPTAAPAAPQTAGAVRLAVDSSASQASYRAREQLVGRTLPSEAVGTSKAVSGDLILGANGSVVSDQSRITVDLSLLQSDEGRRDNFIKGNTLQTGSFPLATFVPRQAEGLPAPLPTSGKATFQLLGDLTVHGVTKPVTWQVTAEFGASSVTGSATTNVNITDFGMTPPKVGPVLSIEDALTLELAFTAKREA